MTDGRIDATKPIGYEYNKADIATKFDDEKKIKQNSVFNGPNVAYMPAGGIGALLNGSQNQPSQSAVQA